MRYDWYAPSTTLPFLPFLPISTPSPPTPPSSLDYMDKVVTLLEDHPDVGLTNQGSNLEFGEENFTVSFASYISWVTIPIFVYCNQSQTGSGNTS